MSINVSSETKECAYGPSSVLVLPAGKESGAGIECLRVFINESNNKLLCRLHLSMLNISSEVKNLLHGLVGSVICTSFFSCCGFGRGARLNAERGKWEVLWGGEMRLENSKDQRNWSSALDDCGSLEGHFPSPTLSWYATQIWSSLFNCLWKTFLPSSIGAVNFSSH